MNIDEYKMGLKKMFLSNISRTFEVLEESINDKSSVHNDALIQLSRYNHLNGELRNNVISRSDYDIELNSIRKNILLIIDELSFDDLKTIVVEVQSIEQILTNRKESYLKDNTFIPSNPLGGNTLIVSKGNDGQYKSIASALENVKEFEQIYIKKGSYSEDRTLSIGKNKKYRIVGEDREMTKIIGQFSVKCEMFFLENVTIISNENIGVCINIMSGQSFLKNNKFSFGRTGIMVQKFNSLGLQTETQLQNNIFSDNRTGLWVGKKGKAVLVENRFDNNLFGIVNAQDLKQSVDELAIKNEFNNNLRADIGLEQDYQDGKISGLFKWDAETKKMIEIELEDELRYPHSSEWYKKQILININKKAGENNA